MGAQLSQEDINELKSSTDFSEEELLRLHKRFKQLDVDSSGAISMSEFLRIPELQQNPLVSRAVSSIDKDSSGEIDFKEFIYAMSVFTGMRKSEQKSKFMFQMYDVDNDGFVSNGDLFNILKTMVGENLSELQLQQLVDRTMYQGDKDKDGKLSFEEFTEITKDFDIEASMNLSLS